ncbi:hypothetical protein PNOK_0666600 [Pyrrhoderma noxium]|uniref:Septin-type G domain-containing protein n=1 Tax=Pyrrhoderma noxium TaxID=2282107 RepID=A0A286UF17_9AGAM|nr:hypothetical protein PNOK_0666600 [Pyrrhoderma noxium]
MQVKWNRQGSGSGVTVTDSLSPILISIIFISHISTLTPPPLPPAESASTTYSEHLIHRHLQNKTDLKKMEHTASTSSSQLYVNQTSHAQLQLLSDPGSDSCYDCLSQSSVPSSPRSAALPSPPDSPLLDPYNDADLDSLSSFPSVSSSVFFSSGMASPIPYSHPHSGHLRHYERDVDAGLIIPSLTLPAALPQPTPYGQTLGELSLMLVGPAGAGKTMLAEFLADSDDIVDVLEWEDVEGGRILHASTDWVEEHDPHGLERFEGSSNLSFFELDGFSSSENPDVVVENVLKHVHNVFNDVHEQLPNTPSSPLLHSLLASPHSTLITALIYVTATPLTTQDHAIIAALSSKVPVIPFSTTSLSSPLSFSRYEGTPPRLASFQPQSHPALRTGLFRSPQTVASLRNEATDRFMRWREVERVIKSMDASPDATAFSKLYIDGMTHALSHRRLTVTQSGVAAGMWSKALWETQLSEDVARRLLSEKEKKLPFGDTHHLLLSSRMGKIN